MSFLKLMRNYAGEIMLVVGTGVFFYNILNFSFRDRIGLLTGLSSLSQREIGNVAYYYTETSLLHIAIGAMLIVAGILIIRNKRVQ